MVAPVHRFQDVPLTQHKPAAQPQGVTSASTSPKPPPKKRVPLWLTGSDRALMIVLGAIALVGGAVHWYQATSREFPTVVIVRGDVPREAANHNPAPAQTRTALKPTIPVGLQININTASAVELRQINGIGKVLSQRIVEDRDRNGPFRSVDDLGRVRGIGNKTVERIRPQVICE